VVSSKKKSTVMNPIWRRMKKRNPSSGQNGQLVHWWLLIHSVRMGLGYWYLLVCGFYRCWVRTSVGRFSEIRIRTGGFSFEYYIPYPNPDICLNTRI